MVFLDLDCWMNSEARSAISASGPSSVSVSRSERMRSVGIRKRRLNLDTVPLSGVRTVLSSGNCHTTIFGVFDVLPALWSLAASTTPDCQTAIAKGDTLQMMPKRTTPPKPAPEQTERTHVTSGINLPVDVYELLNRVAFSRSLKNGGRPSVSALLVDLVQRHRKELEKELGG